MVLIPYYKYQKISDKQVKELRESIEYVSTDDFYPLFECMKEREHRILACRIVDDENFIVRRNIRYRNSFLPLAYGKLLSRKGSTVISVQVRMHGAIIFILLIWFILLIMLLILVKLAPVEFVGAVFMMVVISYFMVQIAFWFEVKKLIAIFDKIF